MLLPVQIVVSLPALAIGAGVTDIVIALLVAPVGEAQARLLVITTVTRSLFCKVLVVNVGLLVPEFILFTFHW